MIKLILFMLLTSCAYNPTSSGVEIREVKETICDKNGKCFQNRLQ